MANLADTRSAANEECLSEEVWSAAPQAPDAVTEMSPARIGVAGGGIKIDRDARYVGNGIANQQARGCHAPVIVVYHDLSARRSPLTDQINVNTDPEIFRRHVRYFAKNFDLIAPGDLIGGALPKRPLLITFDDVYKSVLEVGGPVLREINAQSIWFVNPHSVVAETLPLDNLLSLAVVELGGAEVARLLGVPQWTKSSAADLISAYLPKLSYVQIKDLKARLCAQLGGTERDLRRQSNMFIELADLQRLRHYGMAAGNHSLTHTFFRTLSAAELDAEIRVSRELVEQLTGQSVTYLAIPYGHEADATEAAINTARSSGHNAIFLVHGRSNTSMPACDIYYRVAPGNVRPALLPVSIQILPRLRTIRDRFH
jgi:peptidoglycan/xylan/chitin deacetylase (PgdA/CDA1 family)